MRLLVVHMDLADPGCTQLFDQIPELLAGFSHWTRYRAAGAVHVADLSVLHRVAWLEALRLAEGAEGALGRWHAEQALRRREVGLDAGVQAVTSLNPEADEPLVKCLQQQLGASAAELNSQGLRVVPGSGCGVWLPHAQRWLPVSNLRETLLPHLS